MAISSVFRGEAGLIVDLTFIAPAADGDVDRSLVLRSIYTSARCKRPEPSE
jgi:hypothetical protein